MSAPAPPPPSSPEAEAALTRAAVLAGLCRFVPVPFLDDVLLRRVDRHLVASLLEAHGRAHPVEAIRPLYDEGGCCLLGAAWFLLTLPLRLVWKLVAKLLKAVFFVLALRAAALEAGRAYLLGRALDRCLRDGRLPLPVGPAGPGEPAWEAAARLRVAFDQAFAGADRDALRHAFAGALAGVKALGLRGGGALRRLFVRERLEPSPADAAGEGAAEGAKLDQLVDDARGALARPDVSAFVRAFDERFDQRWSAAPHDASPAPPRNAP